MSLDNKTNKTISFLIVQINYRNKKYLDRFKIYKLVISVALDNVTRSCGIQNTLDTIFTMIIYLCIQKGAANVDENV